MAASTLIERGVAALALGTVLLVTTGGACAADPRKPHIEVVFEIDAINAPTFRRLLPEVDKAQANLAEQLATVFAPSHRFTDWTGTPQAVAPMGRLIARLIEVGTTKPFPRVVVKWFIRTPSGLVEELPLQAIEIYSPTTNLWETGNRQKFETRVFSETIKVIQVQAFQETTFKEVLSKLPIATSATPVESDRVILVPLLWRQVRLGQDSEILVQFIKTTPQGSQQRGSLTLSRIGERSRAGDGVGFVQGGIRDGMLDAQAMPLSQQWNAALPQLLDKATIRCFITAFKLAEYEDGLVREP